MPGHRPMMPGGDGDPAQAPQQRGAAAPRLLAAEEAQVGPHFGQADGLGPVEHADPLVVAALVVVDVGGLGVVGRPQEHELRA